MPVFRLCCVFLLLLRLGWCFNHWVVTEDGKIEYQVSSPFNLRQPYDLMALIQQEKRVSLLKQLKEELISYKQEFEFYSNFDTFDESYRASDPECRNVKLISSYDLTVSTVLPHKHKGIDFLDHLLPLSNPPPAEPFCTLTPLEFSMLAMEHLEGVQLRRSLLSAPETSVLSEVDMRLQVLGSLVHYSLNKNSSSWVLLNLASLYWRAKGDAHQALECIRRALHFSPRWSVDISLLNLANVLHRSRHSQDALVALRVAVSHSPSISVLQYALGNVYAAVDQLNSSAASYQRCMELDYMGEVCQEMFLAAMCEQRMELASRQRNQKLDETQKKLDLFYANMDLVKKQQLAASAGAPTPPVKTTRAASESRKKSSGEESRVVQDKKMKLDQDGGSKSCPHVSKEVEKEDRVNGRDLEQALDQVLNESDGKSQLQSSETGKSTERTRPYFRLVLKPLPPEELEDKTVAESVGRTDEEHCFNTGWSLLLHQSPNLHYEYQELENDHVESEWSISSWNEILMLEKIEPATPPLQPHVDLSKLAPRREYPKNLYSVEFLPYHPLPDVLEEVVYPPGDLATPPLFHDPYWPRKRVCLDLVREMRNIPGVEQYTGTFITPEARGADFDKLFMSVSPNLPYEMRRKPNCSKIADLPLSVFTMDHLEPIMYRANFRSNLHMGEKELRRVVISLSSSSLGHELTFEESGERVYAALVKHGPNWALFELASLYWRVRGDPTQSIECLRRAVHFAPPTARDIGYVGLANVLLRQKFLSEAVIMARAALDDHSNSPVSHYTLAQVYLALRDHVSAALHLRAALHIQPRFSQALTVLTKTLCSLKFEKERQFLREKTKEEEKRALRRQEAEIMDTIRDVVKTGKREVRARPAMVIENREPPEIPEMSLGEMGNSPYVGEDAVKYLVRLALQRYQGKLTRGKEKKEAEEEGKSSSQQGGEEERDEGIKREGKSEPSQGLEEGTVEEGERKETLVVSSSDDSGGEKKGPEDSGEVEKSKKKKKVKKKKKKKIKEVRKLSGAAEAIRREKLEELDRETRQIIKEAAEALNRNQTPVLRRSSPKVYKLPRDDEVVVLPSVGRGRSRDKQGTKPDTLDSKEQSGRRGPQTEDKSSSTEPGAESAEDELGTDSSSAEDESSSTEPGTESGSAGDKSGSTEAAGDDPPVPHSSEVGTETDKRSLSGDNGTGRSRSPRGRKKPSSKFAKQPNVPLHKMRKTREQIREEESRRRFPERRPWPTLEECEETAVPKSVVFTSTWLSVTAKGIKVKDYVDFTTPINPHQIQLPYCHNDFEQSEKTLSHLTGMSHQALIQYKAEKGLQEVLCSLDGMRRPLEEVATRIKLAQDSNPNSWVLSNLAALYWRIVGQGQLAIKCLKHALYYSDENARDVALVSLSNVLYRSGFDIDAAVVIHMSLEFSPTLVVNHFTMANILAAQGLFVEAAGFYESTLQYQPEFQPAADRLRTVRCLILFAKKNARQKPATPTQA